MATLDKIEFSGHITLDFAHFEEKYQDKNSNPLHFYQDIHILTMSKT